MSDEAKGTLGWAYDATLWASAPYPAKPAWTNYAQLLHQTVELARKPGTTRLMRNQTTLGMNNNYWPCLSRLMIMDVPELARYIEPRYCSELDNQVGAAKLQVWFRKITSRKPTVRNWMHAKEVIGL